MVPTKYKTSNNTGHALSLARELGHYSTILILLQYNQYTKQILVNALKNLPFTELDEEDIKMIQDIYHSVLVNQKEGRGAINQIIKEWNNPELVSLYNI